MGNNEIPCKRALFDKLKFDYKLALASFGAGAYIEN